MTPTTDSVPDDSWIQASRVVVTAGKGGVGSSTLAAVTALAAAQQGAKVLLASVDGKPNLGRLFDGSPLTSRQRDLYSDPSGGQVRGQSISPEQAFGDYLDLRGVGGLMRRVVKAASLDVVAASTPGLEHLLVLGKIKELERADDADLIVVDAPPAGHVTPFLASATTALEAVAPGPLRTQAEEVHAMLSDPQRTQVAIVTLPEETPVNEAIELHADVCALGLSVAPLVVNGCWPEQPGLHQPVTAAAREAGVTLTSRQRTALVASSRFGAARLDLQAHQLDRLDAALPLARILLPRLPTPRLTWSDLEVLASALRGAPQSSSQHQPDGTTT